MTKPPHLGDSLSRVPFPLYPRKGSTELAMGTGFLYDLDGQLYLLTARHNVTGRHAVTRVPLHSTAAIPDNLGVALWKSEGPGWIGIQVDLYDSEGQPDWFEHPLHGDNVDAVAIEISLPAGVRGFPINKEEFEAVPPAPGLDVFVLGYPKGISGGGLLPLWKRGSLASEPNIDIDELPKMLIDTATRQGMSGAPVVAQIVGYWLPEDATDASQTIIGRGRTLVGLYSGRIGDDEFLAQLGTVWKIEALLEIMKGKHRPPT
ncbi:MAG TPA: trypsin-like peptidase domain-containing protein [Gemmatimonadaceae bacterium]|nr:trypsin-like peptidase domain-containing protein [Gemmatimonadaceae bacterium]